MPLVTDAAEEDTAQESRTTQLGRAPHNAPLQAGDWIWPCHPTGTRASVSPWQVVELTTAVNGRELVYAQTATGKINAWPLSNCQRAPQPEDTR
jgi:hypothetical protein